MEGRLEAAPPKIDQGTDKDRRVPFRNYESDSVAMNRLVVTS